MTSPKMSVWETINCRTKLQKSMKSTYFTSIKKFLCTHFLRDIFALICQSEPGWQGKVYMHIHHDDQTDGSVAALVNFCCYRGMQLAVIIFCG